MADHEERRKHSTEHATELRRAADALDETRARLRQTGEDLRERGRELDRTRHIVRDVARTTVALRSSPPRPDKKGDE
jgi:hypothetical protein